MNTAILVGGLVIVAVAGIYLGYKYAKASGKAQANKEHAEATVERANNAAKNRDDVKSFSDDELNSKLRR